MAFAVRPGSLFSEGTRLIWLIVDQGLFALSNFIGNVLFARWLLPVDYGIFAVSFSGYLLLTVFHFGVILEPLLIQSTRVEAHRLRSYIVVLIHAHVILIAAISVAAGLCAGVAWWLDDQTIALAIIGASIGGSFMVTLLTARRLCLAFLSSRVSAFVGLLYMGGVVTSSYLLHQAGQVSWFDLWLIMGAWSLLGSAVIFVLLYASLDGNSPYTLIDLCRFQWQYARYSLVGSIGSWFRFDGIFLLLAHFAGLETVAGTRAILNLGNPMMQVHLALHSSWLVEFTRNRSRVHLWRTALVYGAGVGLVVVAAFMLSRPLTLLTYGGRYLNSAWLLPLYCLAQAFHVMESLFSCYMKASKLLLWRSYAPQLMGSVVSLAVGLLLIPKLAEAGFMVALIASFAIGAALAICLANFGIVPGKLVFARRQV